MLHSKRYLLYNNGLDQHTYSLLEMPDDLLQAKIYGLLRIVQCFEMLQSKYKLRGDLCYPTSKVGVVGITLQQILTWHHFPTAISQSYHIPSPTQSGTGFYPCCPLHPH